MHIESTLLLELYSECVDWAHVHDCPVFFLETNGCITALLSSSWVDGRVWQVGRAFLSRANRIAAVDLAWSAEAKARVHLRRRGIGFKLVYLIQVLLGDRARRCISPGVLVSICSDSLSALIERWWWVGSLYVMMVRFAHAWDVLSSERLVVQLAMIPWIEIFTLQSILQSALGLKTWVGLSLSNYSHSVLTWAPRRWISLYIVFLLVVKKLLWVVVANLLAECIDWCIVVVTVSFQSYKLVSLHAIWVTKSVWLSLKHMMLDLLSIFESVESCILDIGFQS